MEVNVRAIFENCLLHLENDRNFTAVPYDLTGDVIHRVTRCSFPRPTARQSSEHGRRRRRIPGARVRGLVDRPDIVAECPKLGGVVYKSRSAPIRSLESK